METKWSLEFVEKRMAEHKRQMHALECRLIEEVIDEFQSLPARAPKQSGWLFETLPGHDETKAEGRVQ